MTGRTRWSVRIAAIAVAAASVPLLSASHNPANAATVTCTASTAVFDARSDGTLWLYQHTSPATGAATWSGPVRIGVGWQGRTIAGAGGDIYNIATDGSLRLLNYDVATGTWANNGSYQAIGSGWQAYLSGAGRTLVTIDSQDTIYAVDPDTGELRSYHYNTATRSWDNGAGTVLDAGWSKYNRIFAAGPGVLYAVDANGNLFRYRYDPASQRFTEYADEIGTGWTGQAFVFSPGGDVVYDVNAGGAMVWFRFNDDTQTWDNNAAGKVIGSGWAGSNMADVSSATDTCSVPAPAPVGTVSPVAGTANDPIGVVADPNDPSGPPFYLYLDQNRHAVYAQDNGATGLNGPVQIGTQTFTSALATGSAGGVDAVAGIDGTGQVWLARSSNLAAGFGSLAGWLTSVGVTNVGAQLVLCGVDNAQQLWCRFDANPNGGDLTAWRNMSGPAGLSGPLRTANSGSGAYGVATRTDGTTEWFLTDLAYTQGAGVLPGSGAYDLPAPATGTDQPTFFARNTSTGRPSVFLGSMSGSSLTGTWTNLPPLTVAAAPLSAADVGGVDITAVAALGQDGYVYVSNQTAGGSTTFTTWQKIGTEPAATPPTIATSGGTGVDLVFRGQDGAIYHYTAPAPAAGAALVFTGGPHS